MRLALLLCLALVAVAAACADSVGPVPCTVPRATQVDTLGWVVRAPSDTVGPILAWTCDQNIHLN